MTGEPKSILIEHGGGGRENLWRMTIRDADGETLDYTLASSRWQVWRMACSSWRHLRRQARKRALPR